MLHVRPASGKQTCNFIKKGVWHKCFPINFLRFTEHLWTTASEGIRIYLLYLYSIDTQAGIYLPRLVTLQLI